MRELTRSFVINQPRRAAELLSRSDVVEGAQTELLSASDRVIVFEVRFDPPPKVHLPGYPDETVRIAIRLRDGRPFTVPIGPPSRGWLHRNVMLSDESLRLALEARRTIRWEFLLGSLCLEYDLDPDSLRWSWDDGFDSFVRIVQRHLWFEEYWRRTGAWPVEDTPHEPRFDGRPHPIRTPELRAS